MKMSVETSLSTPATRIQLPDIAGSFAQLAALIATWRERHAWRCDLRRMDDHMLMDIGMARADAEAEIAKPFWRR
jgi:uncharacterized protein YjiS (DUF1127 family)